MKGFWSGFFHRGARVGNYSSKVTTLPHMLRAGTLIRAQSHHSLPLHLLLKGTDATSSSQTEVVSPPFPAVGMLVPSWEKH